MSQNSGSFDDLTSDIDRELALFRGEPPPARGSVMRPRIALAELLLGGAIVGLALLVIVALSDDESKRKRRGRGR